MSTHTTGRRIAAFVIVLLGSLTAFAGIPSAISSAQVPPHPATATFRHSVLLRLSSPPTPPAPVHARQASPRP